MSDLPKYEGRLAYTTPTRKYRYYAGGQPSYQGGEVYDMGVSIGSLSCPYNTKSHILLNGKKVWLSRTMGSLGFNAPVNNVLFAVEPPRDNKGEGTVDHLRWARFCNSSCEDNTDLAADAWYLLGEERALGEIRSLLSAPDILETFTMDEAGLLLEELHRLPAVQQYVIEQLVIPLSRHLADNYIL